MNKQLLFENKEMRRLFSVLFIFTAVFMLLILIVCYVNMHSIETQLFNRESVIAGKLLKSGNAGSDNIINAFVTKGSKDYTEAGENVFKSAGYDKSTVNLLLPFLHSNLLEFFIIIAAAALLYFSVFSLFLRDCMIKIYKRIDNTGRQAVLLSRGNYSVRLNDSSEGSFARMNHAFNELTADINAGFEKLGRQREFLKNLIADISHQLKTPLSALKMYNEIIMQEQMSDAALEFTKKSGEQLERMEWLILGLLKMARVEAGCLDFNLQTEDLTNIIEETLNGFSLPAKENGINLKFINTENLFLKCDSGWLKEAIGNIIKNCMEHTPSGGKITVRTEQTPVLVSIKISDSGRGIHPDDLPYIFRRFYRGHGSHSAGSGIGLSLAKSITEQMGGTLSAGGEYGQGAEFIFSFLKDVI